jgi:hypothetical protein
MIKNFDLLFRNLKIQTVLVPGLFLFSCSTPKRVVDNTINFNNYHAPFIVFSVGGWTSGYEILILKDAADQYLTIKVPLSKIYKRGDVYQP